MAQGTGRHLLVAFSLSSPHSSSALLSLWHCLHKSDSNPSAEWRFSRLSLGLGSDRCWNVRAVAWLAGRCQALSPTFWDPRRSLSWVSIAVYIVCSKDHRGLPTARPAVDVFRAQDNIQIRNVCPAFWAEVSARAQDTHANLEPSQPPQDPQPGAFMKANADSPHFPHQTLNQLHELELGLVFMGNTGISLFF